MVESLMIQSIESDNRNIVNFSDKYLPRFGRHGELFVVNGILYIFADFDNSNHGKWFPLSDQKEIYSYVQVDPENIWNIPIDFQTDNVQVIVYDQNDKIYPYTFDINISERNIQIVFEDAVSGSVHLIVNKSFDWVDRRFIVADRNFAVTVDEENINLYYIEIDTAYVKILKDGNTTFKKNVAINETLTVSSITNVNRLVIDTDVVIHGDLEIDGNTVVRGNATIEGDLTVQGTTTTVNTTEIILSNNSILLNSDAVGIPSLSASVDINRGDDGIISLIKFDETLDVVTIPVKQDDETFLQEEIASTIHVSNEISVERDRALSSENLIETHLNLEITRLNNEITRATTAESLLQIDINTRATIADTYDKTYIDTMMVTNRSEVETLISESVPTPEETLNSIKEVHGSGSGLDADLLDGLDSTFFNHVHGITESFNTSGPEVISSLIVEDGVITGINKRNLTLSDLGYVVEQAISTITGLQGIINSIISRIESLEAKTQ